MSYAELDVTSNFTFLTGASHPEELVARAGILGLSGIAIVDTNTFAGIVRAHAAAKTHGVRYIVGVRLVLTDGSEICAYPESRKGYGHLCRLLTTGKRRTVKGKCELSLDDVLQWGNECILIVSGSVRTFAVSEKLKAAFGRDQVFVGVMPRYDGNDAGHFAHRASIAARAGVELVAMGNVLMHHGRRKRLADLLSCIRLKTTISRLGRQALPNNERRLKSEFEIRRLFRECPNAVANAGAIAKRCRFSLDELSYEYPDEITNGQAPNDRLRELTDKGLARRYPGGVPLDIRSTVEKELRLIAELDYARYFLTVHDVVVFARSRGILCQGRGSAANSVVCYALGITEASPKTFSMVFERFISAARNEPPDIDVDFEHERREEVIQHIYEKYGRHRAGICSTVVHFRSRAAMREVGKAMELSDDIIAALSSQVWGWSREGVKDEHVKAAGLDFRDRRLRQTLELTREINGFPRHLSQHVGGFVMTRGRLDEFCPVENAAMENRTIIEWDKDDIDVIGMLKVDVLALGMLTCIRKTFDLLRTWKSLDYTMAGIPQEDSEVYDMLCVADSLGVFQVESRAQMNFLPRMRPRTFYDLVIQVAIIRPGPIQGDMVHPFIRRRRGEEPVVFPSEELRPVLGKTLGVPLFQEQAMRIAIVAADFSPTEADQLRRSLGSFRGPGTVKVMKERFVGGCLAKGYTREFAESCFRQIEGFSGYGFPESHSVSFALLVYVSAWLKCHHPEAFCCALLNSQPMGFYAPAQIVRDARAHDVTVLPICVESSYWDNVLEPASDGSLAVRLGFRHIRGFREEDASWISAARGHGYDSIDALWRRAGLSRKALSLLAGADAFSAYGLSRREALWEAKAICGDKPLPLFEKCGEGLPQVVTQLPQMSGKGNVFEDYVTTRLTLRDHPIRLLRATLGHFDEASSLRNVPDGQWVTVTGLVITRQRPGTAGGVIFLTLEDDTGVSNVIVWSRTYEKYRKSVTTGRLLRVRGKLQREGIVSHVISSRIDDLSGMLDEFGSADARVGGINPMYSNADSACGRGGSGSARTVPTANDHEVSTATGLSVKPSPRHPREQAKILFGR